MGLRAGAGTGRVEDGEFLERALRSNAFAAGQVKFHATPEGMKSRWTSPLTVCLTIGSTTVLPNPRRFGGDTGGPLFSLQLIAKISPSRRQPTSTRPCSTDNAPYLLALVASS